MNIIFLQSELTLDQVKTENKDVFKGLGCFSGEYKMKLIDNAQPVVHPPRKVPINMKQQLKETLDTITWKYIITPVQDAADWVSSRTES